MSTRSMFLPPLEMPYRITRVEELTRKQKNRINRDHHGWKMATAKSIGRGHSLISRCFNRPKSITSAYAEAAIVKAINKILRSRRAAEAKEKREAEKAKGPLRHDSRPQTESRTLISRAADAQFSGAAQPPTKRTRKPARRAAATTEPAGGEQYAAI